MFEIFWAYLIFKMPDVYSNNKLCLWNRLLSDERDHRKLSYHLHVVSQVNIDYDVWGDSLDGLDHKSYDSSDDHNETNRVEHARH